MMNRSSTPLVLALSALTGAKETFTLPIGKPVSAGGAHALYPRRLTAKYDAAAATYAFELDQLEPID